MRTLTAPDYISGPFASGDNAVKNDIPNESTGTYLASMEDGFPVITMQPTSLGGTPPDGKDLNGILNKVSQFYFQSQNGYQPTFEQDVSDMIGGYPQNAILWYRPSGSPSEVVPVISLIENNTYNFVTTPSYIDDEHWKILFAPRSYIDTLVETIWPVGSTYMGTQNSCPLAALIPGSTWEIIATKIVVKVENSASITGSIGTGGGGTYFVATQSGFTQQTRPADGGYYVSVSNNQTIPGAKANVASTELTINIWRRTA